MATYKPKKKIDKNGTLEEVKIPIESVDGLGGILDTIPSESPITDLGTITESPESLTNSVLNANKASGLYAFKYGGTNYIMACYQSGPNGGRQNITYYSSSTQYNITRIWDYHGFSSVTKKEVAYSDNIPTKTSQLTNNSDFATNSSVDEKIAGLVNSAPEALDTLGELATALETHEDAYDALLETVGKKANASDVQDEFKKKGVHFISDSDITVTAGSSNLSEKWVINGVDGITEPFDGMIIAIRMPSRGSQKGVVLSIDGGNNYYSLSIAEKDGSSLFYYAYQKQSTILFSFNAIQTGTVYLESGVETVITGCWQTADRDNTYIVNQQKDTGDNEKPVLTKSSVGTGNGASNTHFSPNVTINHAKGRLSATELRENGVSLSEKYALKDEAGGAGLESIAEFNFGSGIVEEFEYIGGEGLYWRNNVTLSDEEGNEVDTKKQIGFVPLCAGEGIEFVQDEQNFVSINATGGAGLENVETLDMYMGMVEPPQTDDGIYWVEKAQARKGDDSVIKEFNAYHHIPIVSGEGVKFEQNEEQGQVKISTDLPTVKAKLTPASEVGGGSGLDNLANIDTWFDSPYDIEVLEEYGVAWKEAYVFQDKDENIIASGDMAHRIPLQAGEGIEFVPDVDNNVVKINATGGSGGGISGAWTSGTSGSVTLLSAGLYESKRGVEGVLISHDMFYWDGISMTINNMYDGLCVVSATGVVSFHDKDMAATFEEVFSYRKIGEA